MSAKKIIVIVAVVVVLAGIVIASILHGQASVTKVATGKVGRQDLTSIVNGTGQIKPLTYVNVGATAFGRITHLYVKEGEHVKAGATLATVESVQPQATVKAQEASMAAATLAQRQAALAQARAQTDSQRGHTNQAIASQRANYDALDKTISRAPF